MEIAVSRRISHRIFYRVLLLTTCWAYVNVETATLPVNDNENDVTTRFNTIKTNQVNTLKNVLIGEPELHFNKKRVYLSDSELDDRKRYLYKLAQSRRLRMKKQFKAITKNKGDAAAGMEGIDISNAVDKTESFRHRISNIGSATTTQPQQTHGTIPTSINNLEMLTGKQWVSFEKCPTTFDTLVIAAGQRGVFAVNISNWKNYQIYPIFYQVEKAHLSLPLRIHNYNEHSIQGDPQHRNMPPYKTLTGHGNLSVQATCANSYCVEFDASAQVKQTAASNVSEIQRRPKMPRSTHDSVTSRLLLVMVNPKNGSMHSICRLKILTINGNSIPRRIFNVLIIILSIIISLLMGCVLDLKIVKMILRHPKPVLIGFCAQFGVMPLIAFSIAKIFKFDLPEALGIFMVGCSPGGSNSNQWTLIFDGDIEVSAVMTLINTCSSFFMMPAWLYTLGTHFSRKMFIRIPFANLATNLALIIIPYGLGCLVSTWWPSVRYAVEKIIKPLFVIILAFFLSLGIYVNLPFFRILKVKEALTAPFLPWLGFILGAVLAFIFKMQWKQVKTVGIETGFQNIGVAMLIVNTSLPFQIGARATVVIITVAFLTTVPLWIILIVRQLVFKAKKKNNSSAAKGQYHIKYRPLSTMQTNDKI